MATGARQFDELAQFRRELDIPAAGAADDTFTLSKLEVGGKEFFGINAPGPKSTLQRVNPITATHAEADAIQQALNAGLKGRAAKATLYVDRAPCRACGRSGGLRSLARELGVQELEVISPAGRQIFTPTP
ncbi:MAG: hypothetical protein DWQ35_19875 [Planctomycetota bacterium]|nr:MAG: hypothetical protein DWQ35_19875 [Planctomycetota bacterium]REK28421.1 MAG: hypothetical protein DWQ42_05425 [Planctomycetota bacterium]REK48442.1 MAG: hypothetical protein DWQ46_02575 [Planctomycetota bacterium]